MCEHYVCTEQTSQIKSFVDKWSRIYKKEFSVLDSEMYVQTAYEVNGQSNQRNQRAALKAYITLFRNLS
jgi:hypothetical protein